MQDDCILLIQGPLTDHTYANIMLNRAWKVVVSTWEPTTQVEEQYLKLLQTLNNVEIVTSGQEALEKLDHLGSIAPQVVTTVSGLNQVSSSFVVKVRSDELVSLSNLESIVDFQPNRIFFGNFIVRPWSYHQFHISDHFFAGPTEAIRRAFQALSSPNWPATAMQILGESADVPESQIGLALFIALQPEFPLIKAKSRARWRAFTSSFQLVDMDLLESLSLFARRANVGPISNLREVGELRNPSGKAIDFFYVNKMSQLKPSSKFRVRTMVWVRYLARTYLVPDGHTVPWNR